MSHRLSQRVVLSCAGFCAILGCAVLFGWYTGNISLIQVVPTFAAMQYNTALCMALCGIGLLAGVQGRLRLSAILGGIVVLIASLTIIEYIFNTNIGLDELLLRHYIALETAHPGRMAPNTALAFLLSGTVLLSLRLTSPVKWGSAAIGALGTMIAALGIVPLFGYLTGIEQAIGWGPFTRMAIHTASGFVVLGTGILVYSLRMARTQDSRVMRWFVIPLGGIGALFTVLLWQALIATERQGVTLNAQSPISVLILVSGLFYAILLTLIVHLAQTARIRVQQIESANRALEVEIIERSRAEEKFRQLLESAPDAMVIVDPDGQIRLLNDQAEKMFGFNRKELLDQNVEMLLPESSRAIHPQHRKDFVDHPRIRPMGERLELYSRRKDGSTFPIEISLSPLRAQGIF